MAITPNVAFSALIKVNTGSASALESLGYSQNGVTISENPIVVPIPGDQGGGDEGIPIDFQTLGQTDTIRIELTKYDEAIADKIRTLARGSVTAGNVPTPGTLVFANTYYFRLLILTTNYIRNYPVVLFREPREINRGTRFSKAIFVGTAFPDLTGSGALWNTTTTG